MSTPVASTPTASVPTSTTSARPVMPPSVHVRVVITWLAIFPLVALGMTAMGPFSADWHPVLRALVLTAVVVPLAVYVVVPALLRSYGAIRSRRRA